MRREMAGPMSPETALQWQVHDDKKGIKKYNGFIEVKTLSDFDGSENKGLIVMQDTYRIRLFVYDKSYPHSVDEFYRYSLKTNSGEVKQMYVMDYDLPESQVEYRKYTDGGGDNE